MNRAVFFDRDNTIVECDGHLGDPTQVRLIRGAAHAIASLRQLGFRIIVVTNQGAVARGIYTEEDVDAVHQRIAQLVHETTGGIIDRFYYCPFHPEGTVPEYRREHAWRKPQPGMLMQAAKDLDLALSESWLVGDHERDIQAGRTAGCQTILIDSSGSQTGATQSHYQVETIAEAAAVIAQNRTRRRELQPPVVVTRPKVAASVTREIARPEVKAEPANARVAEPASAHVAEAPVERSTAAPDETEVYRDESKESTERAERAGETVIRSNSGPDDAVDRSVGEVDAPVGDLDVEFDECDTRSDLGTRNLVGDEADERDASAVDEIEMPDEEMVDDDDADAEQVIDEPERVGSIAPTAVGDEGQASREDGAAENQARDTRDERQRRQPASIRFSMPAIQSERESRAQAEDRSERLLMDVLAEIRSWRLSAREFTPLRMFAFLGLWLILLAAVAAAIYLEGTTALTWVGVAIVAQLTIIGLLVLTPRG